MFKDTNLFGVIKTEKGEEVRRIRVDRDTQELIVNHFNYLIANYNKRNTTEINFDGRYKPDDGEVLKIEKYDLDIKIINAINNPVAEEDINTEDIDIENLKYIFMGKSEKSSSYIVFQLIQKSQHLSSEGIKLFQKKGTFKSVGNNGFSITDKVDGIYSDGSLIFNSYHFARRIFDLQNYYIEATDIDVKQFFEHEAVYVSDKEVLYSQSDSWVRRKIALIAESDILGNNSVKFIKDAAKKHNVPISSKKINGKEKIELPVDKKELKELLKFLDEDIYNGPLTMKTFETNSKLIKS